MLVHDKSSEILTPRYLTFFTDWRVRPCSLLSCKMGFFFFEMRMTSHLSELKAISHSFQASILVRSDWRACQSY